MLGIKENRGVYDTLKELFYCSMSSETNNPYMKITCSVCGREFHMQWYMPVSYNGDTDNSFAEIGETMKGHLMEHAGDEFLKQFVGTPAKGKTFALLLKRNVKKIIENKKDEKEGN